MTKLPKEQWTAYYKWLTDYEYGKLGLPKPDLVLYPDMPIAVSQELLTQRYHGNAAQKDIHEADIQYLQACREAAMYLYEQDCGQHWRVIPCCTGTTLRSVEEMHQELKLQIAQLT